MTDVYSNNMPRNEVESRRLYELFSLLTQNIGYLLHVCVESRLPQSPLVMDLATGNSVFLQRLAPSYPTGTLHGTDISTRLFPPEDDLPKNITLSTLDIKLPIPNELQGKYDLVHVRLVVAALLPSEWMSVVRNVATLLKPGGVIQWEECDFGGLQFLRGRTRSSVDAVQVMGNWFKDAMREHYAHGWDLLAEAMEAAGLVQVETDTVSSDRLPETRADITNNLMGSVFLWARRMSSEASSGMKSLEHVEEVQRKAEKDIESGCYLRFNIHVVTGVKPKNNENN